MRVVESNTRILKIRDWPVAVSLAALPVSVLLLVVAGSRLIGGAPWRAWAWPLSGGVVAGVAGAAFATRRVFEFDLPARRLDWRKRGVFGASRGTVPFDEIRCAFVEYHEGGAGKTSRHSFRVTLSTRSGLLPLSTAYSAGRASDERAREIRSMVNAVLGVKLVSESDNDVLEHVRLGRMLEAYHLAALRQGFGRFGTAKAMAYVESLRQNSAALPPSQGGL